MKLEVGKLAVALTDHRCGLKKGDIKEILGMRKDPCGCLVVDVGYKDNVSVLGKDYRALCAKCGETGNIWRADSKWWLLGSRFAPIEDLTESQVDEILDKILETNKKLYNGKYTTNSNRKDSK